MLLIDGLAEQQIRHAIRKGEFDDLPGMGKPLILDDDNGIPEVPVTASLFDRGI